MFRADPLGPTLKIEKSKADEGKSSLLEIVSMLVGLIRANSPDRDI